MPCDAKCHRSKLLLGDLLTPWSRALLEKLTGFSAIQENPHNLPCSATPSAYVPIPVWTSCLVTRSLKLPSVFVRWLWTACCLDHILVIFIPLSRAPTWHLWDFTEAEWQISNQLTPWSRILLQKLLVPQPDKTFPSSDGMQRLTAVRSLTSATLIQFTPSGT